MTAMKSLLASSRPSTGSAFLKRGQYTKVARWHSSSAGFRCSNSDIIGREPSVEKAYNDDDYNDVVDDEEDEDEDDEDGGVVDPAIQDISLRLKVRQHVNPLSSKYLVPVVLQKKWETEAFAEPYSNPLIIDIGCSKGSWALRHASKSPLVNVLGLEIRRPVIELCLKRKARWNLPNVHFLAVNANIDLDPILSSLCIPEDPAEKVNIDTITIQFPDPHFKNKHKKRRVVNEKLVSCIAKYVNPSTKIWLQSDIEELTEDMTSHFANSSFFNVAPGYDVAKLSTNPRLFDEQTEREVATINKGLPVFRMLFIRS